MASRCAFLLGFALDSRVVAALMCAVLLGACRHAQVVGHALSSPVIEYEEQTLDPAQVKALLEPSLSTDPGGDPTPDFTDGDPYRVGPGDSLLVAVYGHPELAIASYVGMVSQSGARAVGFVVDNDGTIQLPLIGTVAVSGKSTSELRVYLETELARYVKDPKVTVQVVYTGSIRYYLLGQFTSPGMKPSDRPLRLLEAMSLAGSIDLPHASLRTAYVARGNRRLPVNFRRLLREGDLTQNVKMRSGDIVMVPDSTSEQAFVFSADSTGNAMHGGPVPFVNGRLDIAQALAFVGYGFRERTQGMLSQVRVIRSDGDRGQYFVVNVAAILDGKATAFSLVPGDVVYVPPSGFTTWNLAVQQLLPSLQAVSGALQPFVQLKYLSKD